MSPRVAAAGPSSPATAGEFAADVRRDLTLTPRRLQPKYLYDALGSALFEAICRLPWYRITRAEEQLLDRHGVAIADRFRRPTRLVELGSGSGEKLARLARAWPGADGVRVHLVDISDAALSDAQQRLRSAGLDVVGHNLPYEEGLHRATRDRAPGESVLVLFLGSNIGNFDLPAAQGLLSAIQRTLRPGDALLLGADLVKPAEQLVLAYDDPLGVTAAFNKNLLVRMNRELRATFDPGAFDHRAIWNAAQSRVEMHLVSRTAQRVSIPEAHLELRLTAGETIWTESSYKFEPAGLVALARGVGLRVGDLWLDADARFALAFLEPERRAAVPFRGP